MADGAAILCPGVRSIRYKRARRFIYCTSEGMKMTKEAISTSDPKDAPHQGVNDAAPEISGILDRSNCRAPMLRGFARLARECS
jgi:hypothetical protein